MPLVIVLIFLAIAGWLITNLPLSQLTQLLLSTGSLVGSILLWFILNNLNKKIAFDAEEKRRKVEEKRKRDEEAEYMRIEEKRRAENERIARRRSHEFKQNQLVQLISRCNQLVKNDMPAQITAAECFLDNAEHEFADGAFAPFWEEIEKATNELAEYYQNLQSLSQAANECIEHAAILPASEQPFSFSQTKLDDARPTALRMSNIVRKAQKDIHFATIYQQMKTNALLHKGFRSLGDAINYMGANISSSLEDLSDRLHVSLDDIVQTSRKNADNRWRYEQDSIDNQKKQNDMLDNIQHGRKPLL